MEEPSYFQNALSSFVTDAACGGAIRHLVDIGYTLDQIVDRLDYPAPRAKVQRIMMDYLYESRVLLKEEPSAELFAAKEVFVQEQDAFGRRSMRKIAVDQKSQIDMTHATEIKFGNHDRELLAMEGADSEMLRQQENSAQTKAILWKESIYNPKRDGKLTELLHRKSEQNGEGYSYVSCAVGKPNVNQYSQHEENEPNRRGESEKLSAAAEEGLRCLNSRQRDYIQGIRWDRPVLYHRLNQRMLEIIGKLYEAGVYGGTAFFAVSREKITIPYK